MNCARRDNATPHFLDKKQATSVGSHRSFIDVIESVRQQKIVSNERFVMGFKMLPPHLPNQRLRVLHMMWKQALNDWSFAV